jgi:anti-anti-sigma factor
MVDISVEGLDHVTLVEANGRIDGMNAGQLGNALNEQIDGGKLHIVLDLAKVEYMSSAGLRELVNGLKKVKRVSGDIRIAQPSARVREVLEMAGLDTIFLIFDTRTEAVASYT